MRIAIDYTAAVRQSAGIGRYTRSLIAALAKIDREDDFTLFVAGQKLDAAAWPENFTARATPLSERLLTFAWQRLRLPIPAEVMTGKIDIFHAPDFTLPPLHRAAGVVTVHDLSFLRVPHCADPGLRAYLERAVPRSLQRAARVLADSHSTKSDLVELLDVSPDRISVVPGGVDPCFAPVRDAARLQRVASRYHLPKRFILSLGTLEPRKNYPTLIAAYALLRQHRREPIDLVIVGKKGWLFHETFDAIARLGLQQSVHFPGFVADDDLPALYSLAELFAFPSLYEGFGLPPLEAMACGTPVVTSNNSSLPEAVGNAAMLVDAEDTDGLADSMQRLLTDPALRKQLVDAGRRRAAQFTWDAAAGRLRQAYALAVQASQQE